MRTRRGRVCALQRERSERPPRRLRTRRLSLRGHMPQRAGLLQVRGPNCFSVPPVVQVMAVLVFVHFINTRDGLAGASARAASWVRTARCPSGARTRALKCRTLQCANTALVSTRCQTSRRSRRRRDCRALTNFPKRRSFHASYKRCVQILPSNF